VKRKANDPSGQALDEAIEAVYEELPAEGKEKLIACISALKAGLAQEPCACPHPKDPS
jgi:hypothetical protein